MRRTWPSGRIKYNCFLQTIPHRSWWSVKDSGGSLPVAVSYSFLFFLRFLVKNTIIGRLHRADVQTGFRARTNNGILYIYICKRRNDNNYYYNYRKSPRAATIGDDGVLPIEKLATSSGLTPLIVTALYRRNANASCVTWLSCCNNIPPSYDRPNASSFVVVIIISHFFFKNIYTLTT